VDNSEGTAAVNQPDVLAQEIAEELKTDLGKFR
jgi:hypothetical protein